MHHLKYKAYSDIVLTCFIIYSIFKIIKSEWVIKEKRPIKEWPDQGRINFKNYSVKYRDELDYALKSINTEISPREKVYKSILINHNFN